MIYRAGIENEFYRWVSLVINRRGRIEKGFYLTGRVRTVSETSSESGDLVRKVSTGVGYDVDGKFSFTKVRTGILNNIELYDTNNILLFCFRF